MASSVVALSFLARRCVEQKDDHAEVGIDDKGMMKMVQILTSVNFGWAETDSLGCRKHPSTDDHHL